MAEYLSMGEGAEQLGVDRRRLRILIERYQIPTADDPMDFRKRLIEREDLERLKAILASPKKEAA